ncbi:MAG: ABC transporter substrate-binding protein [Hungatella sp.]|jgi:branched-chain amino acid transport system substrate-binding protein|nr:ABC transporter substrate-binding protein [Hungatella sp.]
MKKSFRKIISAMAGISMIAALAGCGRQAAPEGSGAAAVGAQTQAVQNDAPGTQAADGSAQESGKNKLAYFFPLTGEQMQYGTMLQRGAELALELYNEEHGTSYTAEFHDDKGDATEAVNVANKIVADPSVIAGLGSYSSSCAMAAAPIFEDNEMLLFSPNASHTDFPAMGRFMFSCVMSQKYEGAQFADELFKVTGAKKLAIIYQNTDQGVLASELFSDQWKSLGGEVVAMEAYVTGSTKDFSPVLSKIKEAGAEVIYASAAYNEAAQIFLQAKNLNIEAQLVGPGMCLKNELLEITEDKADGAIVLSSIPYFAEDSAERDDVDEATKNFITRFTEKYGEIPDGFAASSYDTTNILLGFIDEVGTDSDALRQKLAAMREFNGVSGYNMAFNENKEMVKGIYVFEIRDNTFVRIN